MSATPTLPVSPSAADPKAAMPPAQYHVAIPLTGEQSAAQAEKLLLTGKEIAARLGVSSRCVEKWTTAKLIPSIFLSSRMRRYRLPSVLAALEKFTTATVHKK